MHDKLNILWATDNPITTEKMVFMYGHNALLQGWWQEVTIIIWGASAKLIAENTIMQKKLAKMMKDGVQVSACKACADQLGVSDALKNLGIEVKFWGEPLTEILKGNEKLITI